MTQTIKSRRKWIYTVTVLVILIVVACLMLKPVLRMVYPLKYQTAIGKYSNMYNLDIYLVMGIISAESKFDKDAVSHKNAKGLMQIKDETADWCIDKFDIDDSVEECELNIYIGCAYMRYLIDKYDGNTDTALAAYNAGEGNVSGWLKEQGSQDSNELKSIPFGETEKYVKKVNERKKIYKFLY